MALNATKRKALRTVLQASSRNRISADEVEAIALQLIDGKKTLDDFVEKTGISKATLKKHLTALAEDPTQPEATA